MCKPDNDSAAMESQATLSRLIGSVERAAAEVSRVALQHQQAQSPSCDSKLSEKMKAFNATVPTKDAKGSHSSGTKRIPPDRTSPVERHLRNEENQEQLVEEEGEEDTTIGTRTKKRRRIKRHAAKESEETEKGHKRTVVYHNYHDYATNPVRLRAPPPSPEKKGRGGITSPFPMVLHNMLNRAKSDKFEHIVSWQPHGRCFLVHDQERFVKDVMPMFFRQSRFSSFQRQLSLYGFLRLTQKNEDYSAYYHELFLRGMPHLCTHMQRTRVKGYWVRQSSSPDTEPDFYSMPCVNSETESPNKAAPINVSIARNESPVAMPDGPGSSWSIPTSAGAFSYPLGFFLLPSPAGLSASLSCFPETRNFSRLPPMPPLRAPADGSASLGTGAGTSDRMVPGSKWNSPAFLGMGTIKQPLESNSKLDVFDLDPHVQRDLVAFLSDVDLDTDDEDEDQKQDKKVRAYRDEEELGRIFADNHQAKK
jgi:hypothetical protein